jgi:single-stranded DNA-binding protein
MATFHGAGFIAGDIIRRETKQGVLATFRLASGAPGKGRHWITIKAWGHTAGILHTHGQPGRGIAVSGRLTSNTWRDQTTSEQRTTLVVTAADLDFLDPNQDASELNIPNHVLAVGKLTAEPTRNQTGEQVLFTLTCGQAGTKTGRLWLPVESWGRTLNDAGKLRRGDHVAIAGRLAYRTRPTIEGEKTSGHELSAYSLSAIPRTAALSR